MGPPLRSGGDPTARGVIRAGLWELQWGRRFAAAETRTSLTTNFSRRWLQWGRRFAAAETRSTRRRARGCWSFNGAAASQRRRRDVTAGFASSTRASMGPPLRSGGDAPPQLTRRIDPTLQWGRRFAAAETCTPGSHRLTPRGLQWGRRFAAAETAPSGSGVQRRLGASMGPPLRSGGDEDTGEIGRGSEGASMGPPLRSGGDGQSRDALALRSASFNGAAASQRRRRACHGPRVNLHSGLQWGRRFAAAETRCAGPA